MSYWKRHRIFKPTDFEEDSNNFRKEYGVNAKYISEGKIITDWN